MFIEVFGVDAYSKVPMTELPDRKRIWDDETNQEVWETTFSDTNVTMTIDDTAGNQIFESNHVVGKAGTVIFTYKIPEDT